MLSEPRKFDPATGFWFDAAGIAYLAECTVEPIMYFLRNDGIYLLDGDKIEKL